jgi:hypothetical protein
MPNNEKAQVMRTANEIQRYLESHPNAADTAEGIAEWWLLRQRFEDSVVLVQEALDYLVAESAVARKKNLDGEQVYFGTSRPPKDES